MERVIRILKSLRENYSLYISGAIWVVPWLWLGFGFIQNFKPHLEVGGGGLFTLVLMRLNSEETLEI